MSLSKYQFVSIKPGYNGWGGLLFHNNKYYKKFVRSILKKVFINNYIFFKNSNKAKNTTKLN